MRLHPEAYAADLRSGAVVSLHSVLGAIGVLHNPSRITFAVRPASQCETEDDEEVDLDRYEYRFVPMPDELFNVGDEKDRLDPKFAYPRATPERALCDWVFLAIHAPRWSLPPFDTDVDDLDHVRLARLAAAMGIEDVLNEYVEGLRIRADDPLYGFHF